MSKDLEAEGDFFWSSANEDQTYNYIEEVIYNNPTNTVFIIERAQRIKDIYCVREQDGTYHLFDDLEEAKDFAQALNPEEG